MQLYKQHFASEGGDDDEEDGDAMEGEGAADQLAPSAIKKRLVGMPAALCLQLTGNLGDTTVLLRRVSAMVGHSVMLAV